MDQLSFIDLLYAVPVGDLAMRVSGAKLHQISTADWSALALILAVIVLSWIGLHKNRAVMADDERIHRSIGDIQFRSMRFVQFMVEIVIVGMYFTMGLTLKLPTTSRSPGPLPSESWLTGLLLCIFAAYLTWDLIDTQQARSNAEKHRAHHHPGHQPPFDWPTRAASGIVVTLVFALLLAAIYGAVRLAPAHAGRLLAALNIGLLIILYAYRFAQDRWGNTRTSRHRSAPKRRRSAVASS